MYDEWMITLKDNSYFFTFRNTFFYFAAIFLLFVFFFFRKILAPFNRLFLMFYFFSHYVTDWSLDVLMYMEEITKKFGRKKYKKDWF